MLRIQLLAKRGIFVHFVLKTLICTFLDTIERLTRLSNVHSSKIERLIKNNEMFDIGPECMNASKPLPNVTTTFPGLKAVSRNLYC
jgi:hypothetical protein